MNIQEFIKQHHHVNYCEAIIFPNGDVEYAIPSHTYKMINITGKSKEVIDRIMPDYAASGEWLVSYTKCVAIWYSFFIYETMTQEQLSSLQELVNANILVNGITGNYTDEYERCISLEKLHKGEISVEELPEYRTEQITIYKQ